MYTKGEIYIERVGMKRRRGRIGRETGQREGDGGELDSLGRVRRKVEHQPAGSRQRK